MQRFFYSRVRLTLGFLMAVTVISSLSFFALHPTGIARADDPCPPNPNPATSLLMYRYYRYNGDQDHFEHILSVNNLEPGQCDGPLGYSAKTAVAGTTPLLALAKNEVDQKGDLDLRLYSAFLYIPAANDQEYRDRRGNGWIVRPTNTSLGYVLPNTADLSRYPPVHPIYRYYNEFYHDDYIYTRSTSEVGPDWHYEGIAFYLFDNPI